jgi:hypothetical protein
MNIFMVKWKETLLSWEKVSAKYISQYINNCKTQNLRVETDVYFCIVRNSVFACQKTLFESRIICVITCDIYVCSSQQSDIFNCTASHKSECQVCCKQTYSGHQEMLTSILGIIEMSSLFFYLLRWRRRSLLLCYNKHFRARIAQSV